jgi:pilus assembly protein CpaC
VRHVRIVPVILAGMMLFTLLPAEGPAPVKPEDQIAQMQVLIKDIQPPLQLSIVGGRIIVQGAVTTQTNELKLGEVLKLFPDAISAVRDEAKKVLVRVDATLIEIASNNDHDVTIFNREIDLSGDISANGERQSGFPSDPGTWRTNWGVGLSVNLLRSLNILFEKGKAKIVARPSVVTMNGESAGLLAGGQIPYTTTNALGEVNTTFKDYGVILNVTPTLLPSGEIMLDVQVENSQPLGKGFATGRTTARVAVARDSTLWLAGLQNTSASSSSGFGFLFPLFGSQASRQRRELLVLVKASAPTVPGYGDFRLIQEKDTRE